MKARRLFAAAALAALGLAGCASTPTPTTPVQVKILAINDFHGNLKPPVGGIRIPDPADPTKRINVPAGGVEQMATLVEQLKAKNPNHVFVAAGDLVGASPLLSSLFHDEPSIEAMGTMGLEAAAIGNHELDQGSAELLRLQNGGCHPTDGCKGPQAFSGARFRYLAANTVVAATGQTLLPPYFVKRFQGIPVAFIGLTLKDTPSVVTAKGVAGLRFGDEADTVNALVPELKRQGIEAIVLLLHEGGLPTSAGVNECEGLAGPLAGIVKRLDKAVDLVISGHTHRAYNCVIDGRVVTSADRFGTVVTQIDLTLDPASRDVTKVVADNLIVRLDTYAKQPAQTALLAAYERLAEPLAKRIVGRLAAPLQTRQDAAGASTLGQLIADAQLDATRSAGAQIALMNVGGIRAPLGGEGKLDLRYEDLFATQPFHNTLVTMTLSGEQLLRLLEQQWGGSRDRVMQVSRGFAYTWDAAKPPGQRVVPGSVTLDGQPITAAARLRVTVNSFMAEGGDEFGILRNGTERVQGPEDIAALEAYVAKTPGLGPDPQPRIRRVN